MLKRSKSKGNSLGVVVEAILAGSTSQYLLEFLKWAWVYRVLHQSETKEVPTKARLLIYSWTVGC